MSDENVGGWKLVSVEPSQFQIQSIQAQTGCDEAIARLFWSKLLYWASEPPAALSAHGQPAKGEPRPMDTYVSGLALLWMPEFDHYAAGWWKGSVISGITRLQTPLVQDDKQLWLEMTDMQPLGWMPLPEPPTFLTGPTP